MLKIVPAPRPDAETVRTAHVEVIDETRLVYSPCDVVRTAAGTLYPSPAHPEWVALAMLVEHARVTGYATPENTFRADDFYRRRDAGAPTGQSLTLGGRLAEDAEKALVRCACNADVRDRLARFGFDLSDGVGLRYRNPHKGQAIRV